MAIRPVFIPSEFSPFVEWKDIDFDWSPGFSLAQKQRSITALHAAARQSLGIEHVLEISTKSPHPLGAALSAFRLEIAMPGGEPRMSVEAAFQGSKVFEAAGQLEFLYGMTDGREIKRLVREHADDPVVGFRFQGREWPTEPATAFYDWLYLTALTQRIEHERRCGPSSTIHDTLINQDAFTDIEFNPSRSLACQAATCAMYVGLVRRGVLHLVADPVDFLALLGPASPRTASPALQELRLFDEQ